jgi:hypothetical protein
MRRGLAAEYAELSALLAAIHVLRARGFTELEAYSPTPVEQIDEALGKRRSPLALAAGIGAALGAGGAYFLQWWLVGYLYPVDVGSRPPHMPLAYLIITIEMGFLFGALLVSAAFLIGARLLKLWEPLFEVPGFESATRDRFWLAIGATDPKWDRDALLEVVKGTGPLQLHGFGGAE